MGSSGVTIVRAAYAAHSSSTLASLWPGMGPYHQWPFCSSPLLRYGLHDSFPKVSFCQTLILPSTASGPLHQIPVKLVESMSKVGALFLSRTHFCIFQ